jgi:leucyl aminopeptidase
MSILLSSQIKQLEALIVLVDENKKILGKLPSSELADLVQKTVAVDFKGKLKETLTLYPQNTLTKRILVVGAGKTTSIGGHQLRALAACAVQTLKNLGVSSTIGLVWPLGIKGTASEIAQSLTEGQILSQLRFTRFKSEKEDEKAKNVEVKIDLVIDSKKDAKSIESGIHRGTVIAEGVNWARRIIHTPGGHLNPDQLAEEAEKLAKNSAVKSKIKGEFWTVKELEKNKFGGVLGVGQGSSNPPRFIVLEYWGAKKSDQPVALVGKGVTFDSGGLSLKPPASMETMKYDMAGAGSVLAAFKILTELQVKANVIALVPTAENMPSGDAIRPGDVLTMASGKTVEVLNTDAEGRLILADALFWATTKYHPRAVVDVATLTGACAMLVGEAAAGLFSNSKKLEAALGQASSEVKENFFPLPNYDDFYSSLLKSDIADLKNIGGKEAGASTAAIFLRHFVHNKTPWAHLDIAGCGWYDAPRDFITQRGPSGVCIRSLVNFVEKFGQKKF